MPKIHPVWVWSSGVRILSPIVHVHRKKAPIPKRTSFSCAPFKADPADSKLGHRLATQPSAKKTKKSNAKKAPRTAKKLMLVTSANGLGDLVTS